MRPSATSWRGGLRIGADFFKRREAIVQVDPAPRGLVDRIDHLANPCVDVSRIHPAVVAFFEDIGGLDLLVRSEWRFPFSVLWRVARPLMRRIGQLVMPIHDARIVTRVFALSPAMDGRERSRTQPRAVIRTYADSGEVMQTVAYATEEQKGSRYLSVAFPLPGGHLLGVLRLEGVASSADATTPLAVRLTSERRQGGASGVWLVMGKLMLRVPFGERIELWAAATTEAPHEGPSDAHEAPLRGATFVGRHTQTVFGIRFVTHRYWFKPSAS